MYCNFITAHRMKDFVVTASVYHYKTPPVPAQLKIEITKAIIQQSKNCGTKNGVQSIGNNCAIATALADIFPSIYVTDYCIFPFGREDENGRDLVIPLPAIARQFVKLFDGFRLTPKLRLLLPEFEFTIEIGDEIIEQINIDEVRALLEQDKKIPGRNYSHAAGLLKTSLV